MFPAAQIHGRWLATLALALSLSTGAIASMSRDITIPLIDLAGETGRQVVVDREAGQYLGHISTVLFEDGKTIFAAYPKGHGRGPILLKKSVDGGLTWSERLPTPENWATSAETPTIHRVVDASGKKRLILWSGLFPARLAVSEDDGATWSPLKAVGEWGGIVVMGSVERLNTQPGEYMAMFHDDGRYFQKQRMLQNPPQFSLYKTFSNDGGLTWQQPEAIVARSDMHLCEPGLLRSPDGKQIAVLLRENSRGFNSQVIFSNDEGKTWTDAKELPASLTGDRHTARYSPEGRLFISFRDMAHESATRGDWVAWVGRYADIVAGREGQYRVRLAKNYKDTDCAYPGMELLPDGTIVATTYGHWVTNEPPYILSVRLKLAELDAKPRISAQRVKTANWPQFRGPGGTGVGVGSFPTVFGPQTNVAWKTKVPAGHSSPIIWQDTIFLTGYADGELLTLAYSREDGHELWRRGVPPGTIERGAPLGNPATATPACDGERVVSYFGSFGLLCFDMNGKELWRVPMPVPVLQHGAGTSPLITGDMVLLNRDEDVDAHLLAVDKRTGKTLWRTDRTGFRRGFSTPFLWPTEKPEIALLPGTLRCVAYSLKDGSQVWSVSGLPNEMVSSATGGDGRMFVAGWTMGSGVAKMPKWETILEQGDKDHDGKISRAEAPTGPARQHFPYIDADKDGFITQQEWETIANIFDKSQNALLAIRPDGKGEITETHVIWKQTRGLPYCPSPLYYQGNLYTIKNGGMLSCFNSANGNPNYLEERIGALGDYYASPVAADGKVCVISINGVATVIRAGNMLEILSQNALGEQVLASPAISGGKLYIRSAENLWTFGTR